MRLLSMMLLIFITAAGAQADKLGLKKRLLKQDLYLKGMWVADDLSFDREGKLATKSETTSFTLSGVEILKVDFKPEGLSITGRRIGLELGDTTPKRVILTLGQGKMARQEPVTIHVDHPVSGDYAMALAAIFTTSLSDLVPGLPSYWQSYAAETILHVPPPAQWTGGERPRQEGGPVTEAIIAKAVDPEFTPYARSMLYKGKGQVWFIVGKNGRPSAYQLVKPLGLGLDEAAIAAIKQYVFGPATLRGQPVAVSLVIEANFEIF